LISLNFVDVLLKRKCLNCQLACVNRACSLLVVVIGCRKCSNEPGMSCSCKLFAAHLLFDVITEQINDDDDDDDDYHCTLLQNTAEGL